MTDLAPARSTQHLRLTRAVWREVVVQHERYEVVAHEDLDALLVSTGTQSDRRESLRFASREDSRAMRPWKNAYLAIDGPDVSTTSAIDSNAFFDDLRTNNITLNEMDIVRDFSRTSGHFLIVTNDSLDGLVAHVFNRCVAFLLLRDETDLSQLIGCNVNDTFEQFVIDFLRCRFTLGLATSTWKVLHFNDGRWPHELR